MLVLNVATQPIKMEIAIQKASLELHTTMPQMKINSEAAKLEISQPKGELQIDATQCRYAYGIKNMQSFSRDNAQEGKSAALEAIGKIVAEGERLAHIESGENVVVEMAADTNTTAPRELSIETVPLPEISFKTNLPQINFVEGRLNINFQPAKVEHNFKPGKVDTSVTQYPSIRMWTSEKVDLMV